MLRGLDSVGDLRSGTRRFLLDELGAIGDIQSLQRSQRLQQLRTKVGNPAARSLAGEAGVFGRLAPRGVPFGRNTVGAAQQPTVRVTQFYDPKRGAFGPSATDALTTLPNRGLVRVSDGPIMGTPTPRTHVSPFPASQQTWWTRMMTGRGTYRNYVEFDVFVGDLQTIGGVKGAIGLGRYQQFVPETISLSGANTTFGTLSRNYGQYIFYGGVGISGGALVYEVFDND